MSTNAATITTADLKARIAERTTTELVAILGTATTDVGADLGTRGAHGRMVVAHLVDALADRIPEVDQALAAWDTDLADDRTAAEVALTAARSATR